MSAPMAAGGMWGGGLEIAMMAPPRRGVSIGSIVGKPKGVANAARVSRGSEFDVWSGLSVQNPKRNDSEHVTVTVVIYNTVADGIPTEEDVAAAIDDLEDLYAKCGANGQLADSTFDFMKNELKVKDVMDIQTKIATQPYKPPSQSVAMHDVFPA